jgi:hypothetical protein
LQHRRDRSLAGRPALLTVIRHAFKRISVRLVTRDVRDQVLLVTSSAANPGTVNVPLNGAE